MEVPRPNRVGRSHAAECILPSNALAQNATKYNCSYDASTTAGLQKDINYSNNAEVPGHAVCATTTNDEHAQSVWGAHRRPTRVPAKEQTLEQRNGAGAQQPQNSSVVMGLTARTTLQRCTRRNTRCGSLLNLRDHPKYFVVQQRGARRRHRSGHVRGFDDRQLTVGMDTKRPSCNVQPGTEYGVGQGLWATSRSISARPTAAIFRGEPSCCTPRGLPQLPNVSM